MKKYRIRPEFINLFKLIVREVAKNKHKLNENQQNQTKKKIDSQQLKFSRAKELLLSGDLDADDYRSIKQETEIKITALRRILTKINTSFETIDSNIKNIENLMLDLVYSYQKASVEQRRTLIDILFPEKMMYTINGLHCPSIDVKLRLLYNL
ncbi:hypothetical protein [Mucilaginibacter endophyticus]|uniref:hypothetical protein n=1 Tax=Mucilaginibacter endophyticus TaxID=2675003 RepID=UPI000E0DCEE3|nr:hypothetical protein [Mucilaginibacter endophyticus]